MGKRGALTIILALTAIIMACAVYAEHTASVSMQPAAIYETNTDVFDLRVINTRANELLAFDILEDSSKSSINGISIAYSDFTLLASTIPSDWTRSLANQVLAFRSNFSAISSGGTLVIAVQASADRVDANTTSTWTITTIDLNNETSENTVEISIINDDTPPVLTNPLPYDGMYVKENTTDQETTVTATDNETGVLQVNFNYDDCAYLNDTKNVVLNNGGADTYTNTVDLSGYSDSTKVCFSFNAENNGGELAVYSGSLTIDGMAPTVTLLSPADNALMNSQSDFQFIAEDNLAPTMGCELVVDGNVEVTLTVENNVTATVSVENVSEGQHEWAVRCTDLAGWEATSETRTYILDRTPPSIRLSSPQYPIIKSGTELDFIVTDNFELDGVAYNHSGVETIIDKPHVAKNESHFTINTTGWLEGIREVYVSADDAAGNNITERFEIIVDNTPPEIVLISPVNESDVNAEFIFNATDEYDTIIDCTLYVGSEANGTTVVNTSETATGVIESLLGLGDYRWRIECEDDAGNLGISDTWNVTIIDTTGPEIIFSNVGVVVRGNSMIINATITDVSGVNGETVHATMEDPDMVTVDVALEKEEGTDNYIGSYPTTIISPLGDYIARVFAEDNVSNSNSNYAVYGLTYAYVVTLALSPNPAETGQEVTASGTAAYDSGEEAEDGFVTLTLPDTTIDVALEDGSFSWLFSAPSVEGDYEITAAVTPENGFTFSATEVLTVNELQEDNTTNTKSTTTSGGGTGGSTFRCALNQYEDEDGNCVPIDETEEATDDDNQGDDNDNQGDAGVLIFSYCTDGVCDDDENCKNCPEDCGECTQGVGRAAGFFNLSGLSSSLLWILLLIATILFVLVYLYQYGPPRIGRKSNDKINLDDYLNKRL